MTQGKSERWHLTLKNRILLENYYLPGELEARIEAFVAKLCCELVRVPDAWSPLFGDRLANCERRATRRRDVDLPLPVEGIEPSGSECLDVRGVDHRAGRRRHRGSAPAARSDSRRDGAIVRDQAAKVQAWPNYNAFLPMNIERYYDFWNRGI
jgi:hypothetical protein